MADQTRTARVLTSTGGAFQLLNPFAIGLDHIGHDNGVYAIQQGDQITVITA